MTGIGGGVVEVVVEAGVAEVEPVDSEAAEEEAEKKRGDEVLVGEHPRHRGRRDLELVTGLTIDVNGTRLDLADELAVGAGAKAI